MEIPKKIKKAIMEELDKKDKEIKKLTDDLYLTNQIISDYIDTNKELNKKDKIIDKMLDTITKLIDCPLENYDTDLDCENRCSSDDSIYKKCWKLYFEKIVESEG